MAKWGTKWEVRPEWYNALTSNCTTNLFALEEKPPRGCREELRTQSLLRDEAVTAADPDFSRRIRAALVQRPAVSRVRCLKAGRGAQRGPND